MQCLVRRKVEKEERMTIEQSSDCEVVKGRMNDILRKRVYMNNGGEYFGLLSVLWGVCSRRNNGVYFLLEALYGRGGQR